MPPPPRISAVSQSLQPVVATESPRWCRRALGVMRANFGKNGERFKSPRFRATVASRRGLSIHCASRLSALQQLLYNSVQNNGERFFSIDRVNGLSPILKKFKTEVLRLAAFRSAETVCVYTLEPDDDRTRTRSRRLCGLIGWTMDTALNVGAAYLNVRNQISFPFRFWHCSLAAGRAVKGSVKYHTNIFSAGPRGLWSNLEWYPEKIGLLNKKMKKVLARRDANTARWL